MYSPWLLADTERSRNLKWTCICVLRNECKIVYCAEGYYSTLCTPSQLWSQLIRKVWFWKKNPKIISIHYSYNLFQFWRQAASSRKLKNGKDVWNTRHTGVKISKMCAVLFFFFYNQTMYVRRPSVEVKSESGEEEVALSSTARI